MNALEIAKARGYTLLHTDEFWLRRQNGDVVVAVCYFDPSSEPKVQITTRSWWWVWPLIALALIA